MTFKLTDPFILTNINTTKTSILLFMSRLCPRLSQVKPCNPVLWFLINLIFIWRSEMNKGARESSDTLTLDRKYPSDPSADITSEWSQVGHTSLVPPQSRHQPRWELVDNRDNTRSWDPQSLVEVDRGGSCPALKFNWLMIQIFTLSLSLSLIKTTIKPSRVVVWIFVPIQ